MSGKKKCLKFCPYTEHEWGFPLLDAGAAVLCHLRGLALTLQPSPAQCRGAVVLWLCSGDGMGAMAPVPCWAPTGSSGMLERRGCCAGGGEAGTEISEGKLCAEGDGAVTFSKGQLPMAGWHSWSPVQHTCCTVLFQNLQFPHIPFTT